MDKYRFPSYSVYLEDVPASGYGSCVDVALYLMDRAKASKNLSFYNELMRDIAEVVDRRLDYYEKAIGIENFIFDLYMAAHDEHPDLPHSEIEFESGLRWDLDEIVDGIQSGRALCQALLIDYEDAGVKCPDVAFDIGDHDIWFQCSLPSFLKVMHIACDYSFIEDVYDACMRRIALWYSKGDVGCKFGVYGEII